MWSCRGGYRVCVRLMDLDSCRSVKTFWSLCPIGLSRLISVWVGRQTVSSPLPTNDHIKADKIQGIKLWGHSSYSASHRNSCRMFLWLPRGQRGRKSHVVNELGGAGGKLPLSTIQVFFSSDIHLVLNKNVFKRLVAEHLEAGTTQDWWYNYSIKPFVKQLCPIVLFCSTSS